MTEIHPTAVVSPGAQIGKDCYIGPYCIIGEHVTMGDGCRLHSHVVVDGHTTLGKNNEIYPFASIGLKTQDLKWKGGTTYTQIGDNNTFREYVTIHSATSDGEKTIVGNNNNLLAYCHVAHNVILGNNIIMSNCATLAGHVVVEDMAIIGGMVAIHQFIHIGSMSMIQGLSAMSCHVPPYTLAYNKNLMAGLNVIGLRRRGIDDAARFELKKVYQLLFRSGLRRVQAVEQASELYKLPTSQNLINFVRNIEGPVIADVRVAKSSEDEAKSEE